MIVTLKKVWVIYVQTNTRGTFPFKYCATKEIAEKIVNRLTTKDMFIDYINVIEEYSDD